MGMGPPPTPLRQHAPSPVLWNWMQGFKGYLIAIFTAWRRVDGVKLYTTHSTMHYIIPNSWPPITYVGICGHPSGWPPQTAAARNARPSGSKLWSHSVIGRCRSSAQIHRVDGFALTTDSAAPYIDSALLAVGCQHCADWLNAHSATLHV